MKALYKPAAAPGLELVDRPEPDAGPDEVKIRVLRTGICGTDLHIEAWDDWAASAVNAPLVAGHEFAGEVVAVGTSVRDIRVGDLVSGEGHIVCGTCRNCRAGRRHLCIRTLSVGVNRDGAFAEYVVIPESNAWVHHAGIDLDLAAIFDPFGNAVHTALQFPVVGEDVLITGAGPIGLMAAAVVRYVGARYVVITDISEPRLDLARRMGVDLAVNVTTSSIAEAQRVLGMSEGFDVGLEMSGSPSALPDMIDNFTHGAKVAMLGPARWAHHRRLGEGRHAHDHAQGRLRPGDVRDVVRDERDAALGPGHLGRDHRPVAGQSLARGVRHGARWQVRQGGSRLDGGVAMYGAVRKDLQATLDEIREAGLYKYERELASPQASHVMSGGQRGAELLRQQLSGSRRSPATGRGSAEGLDRLGIRHGQRALHLRYADAAHLARGPDLGAAAHRGDDPVLVVLRREWRAVRGAARRARRRHLRRAQPRIDHRRHPAVQGAAAALQQPRHGRPRGQLVAAADARRRLVVTDGVFSMDGYFAPLDEICALAERHDALVMVDDSHAVGFIGPSGAGTPDLFGVQDRVDIVSGTLGKALGGASGGYISARAEIVELLRQRSRPVPVLERGRARRGGWVTRRARTRREQRRTARDLAAVTPHCSAPAWAARASTCCPASTRSCR